MTRECNVQLYDASPLNDMQNRKRLSWFTSRVSFAVFIAFQMLKWYWEKKELETLCVKNGREIEQSDTKPQGFTDWRAWSDSFTGNKFGTEIEGKSIGRTDMNCVDALSTPVFWNS